MSLHYPERRSGFDRRGIESSRMPAFQTWIRSIADSPARYGLIAAAILLLNAADLLLTFKALDRGAVELNPVMAGLLGAGDLVAAVVKIGVAGLVVLVGWRMRRYRRVVEVSLGIATVLAVVVIYHLVSLAML